MKKLLTITLVLLCYAVNAQTYVNGNCYLKTYDTEPKLLNITPHGYLVTVEVKGNGYYISGKFGQGVDSFDLVKKGRYYVDDVKGKFIVVDNLKGYGSLTLQRVELVDNQMEVYELSNLKLSK